jgi:asparagine synthase (glutamine-hydrolysing)
VHEPLRSSAAASIRARCWASPRSTGATRSGVHPDVLQDTLRGPILASLPFYDRSKVVALLDRLPAMDAGAITAMDPVLMSLLSACVLHERFGLAA